MKFLPAFRLPTLFVCMMSLFVFGCGESDGPAEKAGKALDQAVESTTDSVSDAMKNTGDAITGAAKEAGEVMSEAVETTSDAIKEGAANTGEALNDAGEAASEAVGLKD